jgi:di/tricarboxylate transporter
MTADQWVAFGVLGAALVLFAWGRFRYDLVAIAALIAVVLFGLVPARDAFDGFGHPAVVTVAAVLVISHALRQSGAIERLAALLLPLTGHPILHIAALTGVVTVASAFMNNVGALALMLPVALATASEQGRSPALLLMPLAFGSILGGMTTMIGTPPNVIIATYRAETTGAEFGFFDFSPVGAAVALAGVIFVVLIGWRLIPAERRRQNAPQQLFAIDEYLIELKVEEGSPLVDQVLGDVEAFQRDDVDVVGVARRGSDRPLATPRRTIRSGDVLVLRADPETLEPLVADLKLAPNAAPSEDLTRGDLTLAEGVVTAGSSLDGRDARYLRRRTGGAVALVALARQGRPVSRRLRSHRFRAGDVLLLQGDQEGLGEEMSALGLLPLAGRSLQLGQPRRVGVALGIFALAILAGATGMVPIALAFLAAIVAYVVLDILPAREIYREIDWPVIVLLGAMIPVGRALENTGATTLVAESIVGVSVGFSPLLVLTAVLVLTMFLSDIINNAATALVMAPISVGIANSLGVNPDAFLMAVAVGASCAFLTPIGHQSNTLVMGPGGYRFGDYWRMGLPLEAVIVVVSVPMIALVWPL